MCRKFMRLVAPCFQQNIWYITKWLVAQGADFFLIQKMFHLAKIIKQVTIKRGKSPAELNSAPHKR